jgi:signal transduction histidine kinase
MKNRLSKFTATYFDPALDLRVQAFNLICCGGMASGLLAALSALLTGASIASVAVNLFTALVGFICLRFAHRKRRYRAYFLFAVIAVFLVSFPLAFFTAGGYHSGMPCWFILAIVFTALMLEGLDRRITIIAEFVVYLACCLTAYLAPQTVIPFGSEMDSLTDILVGIVAVGVILFVVVRIYIRIYDNRQKQLESLDRLKTEFFQNMNHEMKTPLAIIGSDIGNADDMLDHGADTADVQGCLSRAQEEIKNITRIVDYSLSLAAAQEGKRHFAPVDFAALLCERAGAFRTLLNKDGNSLSIQIPDGLPMLTGNEELLIQVINNLMINAGRHTKNGAVAVSLKQESGCLTTTVSDTGKGIDPALLSRIWERGVSGDGATGYGLSICKTIVEMHGGEIRVESEPGKGTSARFTLPLRGEGLV